MGLWICPGNLSPLVPGGSLDGIITHLLSQEELLCSLILSHPINPIFSHVWPPQPGCLRAYWTSEGYFLPAYLQIRLVPLCLYERGSGVLPELLGQQCQPCLGQDSKFCPECVSSPRNCLAVCHCHHVLSSQPMCRISLFSQSLGGRD